MRESTPEELNLVRGIIYLIRNKINGKCYVGKSIRTFNDRYRVSSIKKFGEIESAISSQRFLWAIKKYGAENFSFHIIEKNKSAADLEFYEDFYAEIYNCYTPNGYNLVMCKRDSLRCSKGKLANILSQEQIESIIYKYSILGIGATTLFKEYGVGQYMMLEFLKSYGIYQPHRKFSIDEKKYIIKEHFDKKKSVNALCLEFDVSYKKIISTIKEFELEPNNYLIINFTEDEIRDIIYEYTILYYSFKKIAEKYDCDKTTISKVIHGANIPSLKRKFLTFTSDQIESIIYDYTILKKDSVEISKTFNCLPGTIRDILHSNQIQLRNKSETTKLNFEKKKEFISN